MRQYYYDEKGKIIDSGTCTELIIKHGRNNLEETFLKLARVKMNLKNLCFRFKTSVFNYELFPRVLDLIYWPTVQIFHGDLYLNFLH